MNRHRNLTAPAIRSLVSESTFVDKSSDCFGQLLRDFGDIIAPRFRSGRKLGRNDLDNMFDKTVEVIEKKAASVEKVFEKKPATRVHPNGESYAIRSLVAMKNDTRVTENDLYRLMSFRTFGTRKKVQIVLADLPIMFTYHAAERLHEFGGGTEAALKEIAESLSLFTPLIYLFGETNHPNLDTNFAVPLLSGNGMLLGNFVIADGARVTSIVYNREGYGTTTPIALQYNVNFVARTFVDKYRMRPHQAYAMERLMNWNEAYPEEWQKLKNVIIWPDLYCDGNYTFGGPAADALQAIYNDKNVIAGLSRDPMQGLPGVTPVDSLELGRFKV